MRDFANGRLAKGPLARWLRARAPEVSFALALSPAFAWMAPFDTTDGSFLERIVFWGWLLPSWFLVLAVTQARAHRIRTLEALSPAARSTVMLALSAVPMIGIAGLAASTMQGWQVSPWEVSKLYIRVLLIGALVTLLWKAIGLSRPGAARYAPALAAPEVAQPPASVPTAPAIARPVTALPSAELLARLPPALRGPLLCLQMEDHYVRIHTAKGSALALLRLSDAIAQTGATPGRQVHRSWWVSDDAVEGFEKQGRTGRLRLGNGLRVPVSQRYAREVEVAFGPATAGEPPSPRRMT
ncbi:LytTR family transcriptional regulator [Ancylobacter aquaticus]|uniref:LytTR family transcriptional regulator n=1 Tax=Ancylobacter aquaticus TaxID=100 RepID=A0A4R1I3W6_ANCAQ|nr:LytTR family DNA-binding domain-containing protein [Ancylobacter aquaticus]TCK28711.1 LytTR family transcriptional regulator [Ancylobacter aquaticus]